MRKSICKTCHGRTRQCDWSFANAEECLWIKWETMIGWFQHMWHCGVESYRSEFQSIGWFDIRTKLSKKPLSTTYSRQTYWVSVTYPNFCNRFASLYFHKRSSNENPVKIGTGKKTTNGTLREITGKKDEDSDKKKSVKVAEKKPNQKYDTFFFPWNASCVKDSFILCRAEGVNSHLFQLELKIE